MTVQHSYHPSGYETPAEMLEGESKAARQDERVLAFFRAHPGQRFGPSRVWLECSAADPGFALLTSIRRSMTNLTNRGLLQHHAADRVPGPYGRSESRWSLAE